MTDVSVRQRLGFATRWRNSVRFRSTAVVAVMVGASFAVGLFVIDQLLIVALRNEVQERTARVVNSMADAMLQGQVPAELLSSPSEFQQEMGSLAFTASLSWLDFVRSMVAALIQVPRNTNSFFLITALLTTLLSVVAYMLVKFAARNVTIQKPSQVYAITK